MERFECEPLRGTGTPPKLTRPACGQRFAAVRDGPRKGDMRIVSPPCVDCAVGLAHLAGGTPIEWPEGGELVLDDFQPGSTTLLGGGPPTSATTAKPPAEGPETPEERPKARAKTTTAKGGGMPTKRGVELEWDGDRKTYREWSKDPRVEALGLHEQTIRGRKRMSWSDEEALTTPPGEEPPSRAENELEPEGVGGAVAIAETLEEVAGRALAKAEPESEGFTDPAALLRRLGYEVTEAGRTPAGHVLIVRVGAS